MKRLLQMLRFLCESGLKFIPPFFFCQDGDGLLRDMAPQLKVVGKSFSIHNNHISPPIQGL